MESINRSIRCQVTSCRHHDSKEYCQLNDITVGGDSKARNSGETQCKSFECSSGGCN